YSARFFDASLAIALAARLFQNLPRSTATRTCLRDLEKSPRADYLPAATAGGTVDRARSGFGSASMAFVASIQFSHLDFLFSTECGFLQRDLHVIAQIRTTMPLLGTFAATAEKRLENPTSASSSAEYLAKNIEWIMKTAT